MASRGTQDHFSAIAGRYRRVRTTDREPVAFIGRLLKDRKRVRAADIGCGAGRYDRLLFDHIKDLHLTCIDINISMLRQLGAYLRRYGICNFRMVGGSADRIPLKSGSMDCILTFNAVHHFDLPAFLDSAAAALRRQGRLFIYTRLRSQNARGIWGRFFPSFVQKETRLYELEEIKDWVARAGALVLTRVEEFRFHRRQPLRNLLEKAWARHYSTFSLYGRRELEESLHEFRQEIRRSYPDPDRVSWVDENVMLVVQKT